MIEERVADGREAVFRVCFWKRERLFYMSAYGKEAHGKEIKTALDFVVGGACECVMCGYIHTISVYERTRIKDTSRHTHVCEYTLVNTREDTPMYV